MQAHPKSFRRKFRGGGCSLIFLLIVSLSLVLFAGCVSMEKEELGKFEPREPIKEESYSLSKEELLLYQKINEVRRNNSVQLLLIDNKTSKVARKYSERMLKENFFAHVSPEGEDLSIRLMEAGINYQKVGENLAFIEGKENLTDRAIRGWLNSPRHKKTMLDDDYTHIGVGIACSDRKPEKCYITTIYLLKEFRITLDLDESLAVLDVPLNSPANVLISISPLAKVTLLSKSELENLKQGLPYVYHGQWVSKSFRTAMYPDDILVVESIDGPNKVNVVISIE